MSHGPGIHVPPPLFFMAGLGAAYLLRTQWPLVMVPPEAIAAADVAAFLLLIVCALLLSSAMINFVRARTPIVPVNPARNLVVRGPYRFTRNPMYVGMTCLYLALTLRMNTWWAVLFLPPVLVFFDRWLIPREEQHLVDRFGDSYRKYCGRVRRWI